MDSGWLQPLIVRLEDQVIIDGTKRWDLALSDDKFLAKYGRNVPVVYHNVDEIDAMILHVRLNRGRGNVHPVGLSAILKKIVYSGKYNENDLSTILVMSEDEIDLLLSTGLLKKKNWEKYEYSRAWVPIEVPSTDAVETSFIERPPNDDR
jgi:ParB-like chromosome segregation protein Spo0J